MSPKVESMIIKYALTPLFNFPNPPNSNQWIVLTFATNPPGTTYRIYQRPNLTPGVPWVFCTNVYSTNPVALLPFNVATQQMWYTTMATQFVRNVTLAWDRSPSVDVVGYKLYSGPVSRNYTNALGVGSATTGTISNVVASKTYFFAATAYDGSGIESDYSSEISYTVPTPSTFPVKTLIVLAPSLPTVLTSSANSPFPTNVSMFGRVMSTGGDPPITMFLYGTKDPTFKTNAWENIIVTGMASGTNLVQGVVNSLVPATTYYCAFASRNAAGISVGNILSFMTPAVSPKAQAKPKDEPIFSPLPPVKTSEYPDPPVHIIIQ